MAEAIHDFLSHAKQTASNELERCIPQYLSGLAYDSGRLLGLSPYPFRRRYFSIGEQTEVEMDDESERNLRFVGEHMQPLIVASNHRAVDKNIYPIAFYHDSMSVDSFILRHQFRQYGMTLATLAIYNRDWQHHPTMLRRVKGQLGNAAREGAYSALGYIPVHKTHVPNEGDEEEASESQSTYPLRVVRDITEHVRRGHSVGFFVYYGDTDETVPERLSPGAVYYASMLQLPILPIFVKNARHIDSHRAQYPDNVVLRVGRPMTIASLPRDHAGRRSFIEDESAVLMQRIMALRRSAFAVQPWT